MVFYINLIVICLYYACIQAMSITLLSPSSKSSQRNQSDNSETSQSSFKIRGDKRTKQIKMVSKRQIQQLNDRVKSQLQKNRKAYDKLIAINPYFTMKLYSPQNNFTTDQYNSQSVELMMKQLELLLDDGHFIQKETMKTQLRKMQDEFKQTQDIDQWRHHYAYLRKIWLNPNDQEASKPIDLIEQLNKKVVIIKNNIFSMIDFEKQSYKDGKTHQNNQYDKVTRKINEVTHYVEEYNTLKQRYQNLKMSYEDLSAKFKRFTLESTEQICAKNELLDKIRQENEQLKKIAKQYKEKLLMRQIRESDLLSRIKQLQSQQKPKRQERSSLQNSISLSSIKTPDLLNFERIKFTKMEPRELLISKTQEENTQTRNKLNLTISVCSSYHDAPEVKPFSTLNDTQENVNQENQEDNGSTLDLSTARSLQKRGRFVRMRSPCNGKLLKNKEDEGIPQKRKSDFLPQRLKDMKQRKNNESSLIISES